MQRVQVFDLIWFDGGSKGLIARYKTTIKKEMLLNIILFIHYHSKVWDFLHFCKNYVMFTKAAIILSIIFCKNKNNNCDFILQFRFFLEILSLYLIIQMFGFQMLRLFYLKKGAISQRRYFNRSDGVSWKTEAVLKKNTLYIQRDKDMKAEQCSLS